MSFDYGWSLLVSSAVNALSSGENRKSSENISRLNRNSSEEIARLSRKHSAELQYNQLKFSVLQQRENQEFQREMAELSHERMMEIEAYRAQVNMAINQKNLDFQKWRFEEEKKIQYDILQLQQDFQRDLTNIQHQNALIQMRERLREDKSPINNLACDLLENSFSHGIMPLKVFLAPPVLDYDPSTGKPYHDSYEGFFYEEIKQFLHQGYLNKRVQLQDRSWVSKKQGGGSALQSLHAQLKSIPVLILESNIPLGELNLSLGYWNSGDTSYTQSSILSGIVFSDLLYDSAKKRALEWEVMRKKLESLGKDEAYIKTMGGVNEENLQIYYKELADKKELEQNGIDTANSPFSKQYKITEEDYKSFYKYLAVWHCLIIGLYADILFLGNSWENTPLLPSLITYLLEKYQNHFLLTSQFWHEAITKIMTVYGQFYDTLKSDASSCLPEIRMKLALSLANLPDEYKDLALQQCDQAVADWLQANNAPSDKIFDLDNDEDCQILKRIFYQEDKLFLDSVKQLLAIVNEAENIDVSKLKRINSLLEGWQLLNRFGTIPQLPAMEGIGKSMIVDEKLKSSKPNPADNFTEMLPGDLALEMVAIPAGDLLVLKPKPTIVKLDAFWMSKYPITQAQFKAIMFFNPSYFMGDNHPVEQVTWDNAQEFCGRLSEKVGRNYSLPSINQWDYAYSADGNHKWISGCSVHEDAREYINVGIKFDEYNWQNRYHETYPIGQKKPNQWGLHDMYGNVYEWCQDSWFFNEKWTRDSFLVRGGTVAEHKDRKRLSLSMTLYTIEHLARSLGYTNDPPYTEWRGKVGFRVVCVL